jgi:hypothetical protein
MKMNRPVVCEFVAFLKTRLQDAPCEPARQVAAPAHRS